MLAGSYLVTLVTSNSQFNFLCEIPHFEPGLKDRRDRDKIEKDTQKDTIREN